MLILVFLHNGSARAQYLFALLLQEILQGVDLNYVLKQAHGACVSMAMLVLVTLLSLY